VLDVRVSRVIGAFHLEAEIHDSGFICVSGLNGSGKTTLLNLIAGNMAPDTGYVRINSEDVTRLPVERRGVVLVTPESMIPHLDVDKHLAWGAKAKKSLTSADRTTRVREELGISYGGRVDKLSLGMRERVSLATALLSRPKVILVDEAFANIDHKEDFIQAFSGLCRETETDLVCTTQSEADAKLSDHHYTMVAGETTRKS
jgi:molybdate/tungstate transport system ATP-binding protein